MAWASLESTQPRRLWRFVVPAVMTLTFLVGLSTPLPYVVHYPGGATPITNLVGVPADRAHPPKGQFLLTTVSQLSEATVLDVLRGWADPDIAVYPQQEALGGLTPAQYRQVAAEDIDESKEVAVAVALRRLGLPVNHTGSGAIVEAVVEGLPAQAFLRAGDVIVGVAGESVALVEDVQNAVAARSPGEVLQLEVEDPNGSIRPVGVPLVACPSGAACPGGGTAVMGVQLRTRDEKFELPFEVTIESEDIGGPSAGLAFALTVIDVLTPGELTGTPDGRAVAVTGTIAPDGAVGPIGGVGQKAAAVTDAGVSIFIVPAANAPEARAHAGEDLTIVPVTDLESTLAALAKLGGDVSGLGPPQ